MAITPIRQDKRFMLTVGCVLVVVVGAWLNRHLNEQELTFIGVALGSFIGASQWGQTKRTVAATEAANAQPPA